MCVTFLQAYHSSRIRNSSIHIAGPIKQKYGNKISWGDLIVLAGNVALEGMGCKPFGFGAGRVDTWQADEGVYWGSETTFVPKGNENRYNNSKDFVGRADKLEEPLGATRTLNLLNLALPTILTFTDSLSTLDLGLIYVNPEGPDGCADPKAAAHDIRTAFGRMGMNDEETASLIIGGHTFGKTHGAVPDSKHTLMLLRSRLSCR